MKYALCVRAKIEGDAHCPRNAKCQAYRRKIEQYIGSIDYGDHAPPAAADFPTDVDE